MGREGKGRRLKLGLRVSRVCNTNAAGRLGGEEGGWEGEKAEQAGEAGLAFARRKEKGKAGYSRLSPPS